MENAISIDIEEVIERAFEHAFVKALDQVLQAKAEEFFSKALQADSPLGQKLGEKIEQGFQRFVEDGFRWEKKGAGFKLRKKD